MPPLSVPACPLSVVLGFGRRARHPLILRPISIRLKGASPWTSGFACCPGRRTSGRGPNSPLQYPYGVELHLEAEHLDRRLRTISACLLNLNFSPESLKHATQLTTHQTEASLRASQRKGSTGVNRSRGRKHVHRSTPPRKVIVCLQRPYDDISGGIRRSPRSVPRRYLSQTLQYDPFRSIASSGGGATGLLSVGGGVNSGL